MSQSIQQGFKRVLVFLLALMLFIGGLMPSGLVTPAHAGILPIKRTYIQTTIDTSSWEILAGVVTWEAGVGGNQAESKRIGATLLDKLAGSNTPSEVADKVSAAQKKEGDNTVKNLVLCFPGKMSFSGWNDNSTSSDTSRAQLIRNSLIYDLNAAFKFVYGENGVYKPAGDTMDAKIQQYSDDMKAFLSNVPSGSVNGASISQASSSGINGITFPDDVTTADDYIKIEKNSETRYFQYRMVKGYVDIRNASSKLGLGTTSSGDDASYIHWGQLAVEAFVNFGSEESLQVTAADVYDSKPGSIEKAVAGLLASIADWIANALGLWNFDEIIFNAGIRGTSSYIGGVFPAGWQPVIWAFFFVAEVVAIGMLLYAIIYNVGRKVMATMDPVARANAIEQIKYLFIVAIILSLLPFALPLMIDLSAQITGVFHDALGGRTATERFSDLAVNSGTIGGVLTYLIYLGALLYFNVFYMFRSLMVAMLMVLSPIFVSLMALNENKRHLTVMWFKEFAANLFTQPIQAIMLSFILLIPLSGRRIESIILAYVMIPVTNGLRQQFFGSAGGMADAIGQKGQRAGGRTLMTMGGLGLSALRGGLAAGMSAADKDKDGDKEKQESDDRSGNGNPGGATNTTTNTQTRPAGQAGGPAGDANPGKTGEAGGAGRSETPKETSGGGANGERVSPGASTTKTSTIADQAKAGMDSGADAGTNNSADPAADTEANPSMTSTHAPQTETSSDESQTQNASGEQTTSASGNTGQHRLRGGAKVAGAVALGALGGGMDYMGKRFFGMAPGKDGGLVTQLSQKLGASGGKDWRGQPTSSETPSETSTDNSTYNAYDPTAPDGGYAQAMAHESSYDDPDSTSPFAKGIGNQTKVGNGASYTFGPKEMEKAGVRGIHKAGQGQSMVSYDMANLGAADQNRMMQMVNMWENGSAEERMAMEAAGIADVQPVSKMVGGQEQVTGANVVYNNDTAKQNLGIDTAPASEGGKGYGVTTSGTQAPAIVPDMVSYMNTPQAAASVATKQLSDAGMSVSMGQGSVSISSSGADSMESMWLNTDDTQFALVNEHAKMNPDGGFTANIPIQEFTQVFNAPPIVPASPATQGARMAAQNMTAQPIGSQPAQMEISQPQPIFHGGEQTITPPPIEQFTQQSVVTQPQPAVTPAPQTPTAVTQTPQAAPVEVPVPQVQQVTYPAPQDPPSVGPAPVIRPAPVGPVPQTGPEKVVVQSRPAQAPSVPTQTTRRAPDSSNDGREGRPNSPKSPDKSFH